MGEIMKRVLAAMAAFVMLGGAALAQDDAERLNALMAQADQAYAEGDAEAEIGYLEQVLALELLPVERFQVLTMKANAQARAGDQSGSMDSFMAALETGQANAQDYQAIGDLVAAYHLKNDDVASAQRLADGWIESGHRPNPDLLLWLAQKHIAAEDTATAYAYARHFSNFGWYPDLDSSYRELMWGLAAAEGEETEAALREKMAHDMSAPDKHAVPVKRPPVDYPRNAFRMRLEGECLMTFNVSTSGRASDIDAECDEREFERPAIGEVRDWRFVPKVVNGETVERQGVEAVISYKMPQVSSGE